MASRTASLVLLVFTACTLVFTACAPRGGADGTDDGPAPDRVDASVQSRSDAKRSTPSIPGSVDASVAEPRLDASAASGSLDASVIAAADVGTSDMGAAGDTRAAADVRANPDPVLGSDGLYWRLLPDPTGPFCLGSDCDGKNAFVGLIDRIRLYDRALAPEEIAAHAARKYEPCADSTSCVGEWTFDAPAVGNAFPSSGKLALPAKIVGEVALAAGPEGTALELRGQGHLELEASPALAFKERVTVEAWVRRSACASCASLRIASSTGSFQYEHHAGGQTTRMPRGGYIGDPWSKQDTWTHVAFTVDVPRMSYAFYVEGKKANSQKRW